MNIKANHIAIVDGNYTAVRAVLKGLNMYNSSNFFTGGAYLFLKMLWNIKDFGYLIVVFDGGKSKFRKEIYPEYKLRKKPKDEELEAAFTSTYSTLDKILPKMGIPSIRVMEQEADDVIYLLAKELISQGKSVTLVSDDADYLQAINIGANIFRPMKDELWDKEKFVQEYKFNPEYFTIYKSLLGDKSDNIPNAYKGLGEVTASKIIQELKEPTLLALNEWINQNDSKIKNALQGKFSLVKRNHQLVDLEKMFLTFLEIKPIIDTSITCANVDLNYVKEKFRFLEFENLTNWLVYLSKK